MHRLSPMSSLHSAAGTFPPGGVADYLTLLTAVCRGPSMLRSLKPDISAPGSEVLAQGFAYGYKDLEAYKHFGTASGTSVRADLFRRSEAFSCLLTLWSVVCLSIRWQLRTWLVRQRLSSRCIPTGRRAKSRLLSWAPLVGVE